MAIRKKLSIPIQEDEPAAPSPRAGGAAGGCREPVGQSC